MVEDLREEFIRDYAFEALAAGAVYEDNYLLGTALARPLIAYRQVQCALREGAELREVVMMGSDFYEGEPDAEELPANAADLPPMGIGKNCIIERAIIDKNARIGDGVVIRARPDVGEHRAETHWIRDGITIIPKNTVIPPGTVL